MAKTKKPVDTNSIFEELAATSSKNKKIEILTREKDNALLKRAIEMALNPFKMYYLQRIPKYSANKTASVFDDERETLAWGMDQLVKLSDRKVTGQKAKDHLVNVLQSVTADDAKVLERIVLKDLNCGVATTPNKIWKGLIPEYPVQLCEPFDQKLVDKLHWPALAQLKCDGMRFNAIVENGKVTIRSRKGQVLDLFGTLDVMFLELAGNDNLVFDGELLVVDNAGALLPRKASNGVLNKAQKGTISQAEAKRVVFKLWDLIPLQDWKAEFCAMPYETRFNELNKRAKAYADDIIVETHEAANLDEAQKVFQDYLASGMEGAILKDKTGPWEAKRVKHQIKMKAELTADLECIGWQEGIKKYKGKLGALKLQTRDSKLVTDCGSGLTDKQRDSLKKKDVLGKIVEVKYNAKIQKEDGSWSLFLPIFQFIRDDKDEANSFEELQ